MYKKGRSKLKVVHLYRQNRQSGTVETKYYFGTNSLENLEISRGCTYVCPAIINGIINVRIVGRLNKNDQAQCEMCGKLLAGAT